MPRRPQHPARPSPRRLLELALAAAGVGLAIAAVYTAGYVDIRRPPLLGLASEAPLRRQANPAVADRLAGVPLQRLSRVHLAVRAEAVARGVDAGKPWSRTLPVDVVLDTGASLAFATAQIDTELALRTAPTSRGARGFSGSRGVLYPFESGEALSFSLLPAGDAARVVTPVEYIAPAALHGAHVIAPPQLLAPIGGAVAIDLEHDTVTVCESVEACREGKEYQPLALRDCPEDPELVGIDVSINGQTLPMHLDTGAPTLVFRRYYDAADLQRGAQSTESGTLSGIGGQAPNAELWSGTWRVGLGAGPPLVRDVSLLWVVGERGQAGPTRCFPAGSVGTDLLDGCRIVLGERPPLRGYVRCPAGG